MSLLNAWITTEQHPEPLCRGYGIEDNGEKVSRCGTCMALKYEAPDGAVRYEVPTN